MNGRCTCANKIGTRFGVVDEPDGRRKVHARVTPLVGGLAIAAPLTLTAVVLARDGGDARLHGTLALALAAYALALAKDALDRRMTATRAHEPEGLPNRFSASGSDD